MSTGSGSFQPPPPPPPPPGWGAGQPMPQPRQPMPYAPYAPPQPVIVQVQPKHGGFGRAVMFVFGLTLFLGVFIVGIFVGIGMLVGVGSMIAGTEYQSVVIQEQYRHGSGRALAIIPIEGEIDDRMAEFVHSAVDEVINSSKFAGVILRVDSPGGGVSASDQIWHEIDRLKKSGYPVIASYGGMAASGGYYVSCGADSIVAEQTCITGSIGVIAHVLTFGGTMEKIGVQPVTLVASGSPEKDTANDMFRAWNDKDKQSLRVMLDAAYETFFDRVKTGRASVITDVAALRSIANGSVYTAQQAQKNGLVDSIGYLDDAIAQMEKRCSIPAGRADVTMLRWPWPSIFSLFGAAHHGGHASAQASSESGFDAQTLRKTLDDLGTPRVMYLMK